MKKSEFIKSIFENEDLTSKIANLDDNQLNDLKSAIGAIDTLKKSIQEDNEDHDIDNPLSKYSNDALNDMIVNLSRYDNTESDLQKVKSELERRKIKTESTGSDTEDDMFNNIINSDNFLKNLNNSYIKGELTGEKHKAHSDFIEVMKLKNSGDISGAIRLLNNLKRLGAALHETKMIPDTILDIITENENPRMKAKDIYKFIKKNFGN